MRTSFRFAIGFALGCALSVCAWILAGAGHGTYAPLIANAPMLAFLPIPISVVASLFGTPLLWAMYFVVMPKLDSRIFKAVAVTAVALEHLGSGAWFASEDPYFMRMLGYSPSLIIFHACLLIVAVITSTFQCRQFNRK